jgi:sarcosine oxidase subunit beta
LYDDPTLFDRALAHRGLQNASGLGVEPLTPDEISHRQPLLDRGMETIVGATFSPRDGLVNPNAVRAWYRREAEALGVRFRNRHYVSGVETARVTGVAGSLRRVSCVDVVEVRRGDPTDAQGTLRDILTSHRVPRGIAVDEQRIACETIVNCLGAWSPVFSAKIGVPDVTEPVRRQISLVDVRTADIAAGVELDSLGMIVDPSGLYYHSEGAHVLAGYSVPDEPPGYDFTYDGTEFFEREIWPRLAARASTFERCGHVRGWAGLYAVTPDRSGIAGAVGGFSNLYEAHSFTGRGVMQSWGVACGMAGLVAAGRYDEIDLSPLRRDRFAGRAPLVPEDLHI